MKSCCRNCHFLVYTDFFIPIKYKKISLERRADIESLGPCCYHGEWNSDDPILARSIKNLAELLDQPDRDCFWPYQEGMTLEAGKRRQNKEIEDKRTKKSHLLMKIGIVFSAMAAASGLVYIIELISTWSS